MGPSRLLSEELGDQLYNQLREKILRDRLKAKESRREEVEVELDGQMGPGTLEEVIRDLKDKINLLAFMKRVRRGMMLHLEYLNEKQAIETREEQLKSNVPAIKTASRKPSKKLRRNKFKTITKKGARRVGRNVRRRFGYVPGHSIVNRLRRRCAPNKGYCLRKQKTLAHILNT